MDKKRKAECTGCRACELSCPVHCIKMEADAEGFIYPIRDDTKCIQCDKCEKICNSKGNIIDKLCVDRKVYAAWNKNSEVLQNSSSGGIFYALAKYVISVGGIVYGAAFTDDYQVEQKRIEKEDDIILLMGAKYVQSDTKRTYEQALEDLKNGKTVLYSGTPCQIRGILNFAKEFSQRLFCVSVICHGVPSPSVWQKYLALKKGQFAENFIRNISFKYKACEWKNFCLYIEFEKRKYVEEQDRDLYMKGFLQNLFLRPSCYYCTANTEPVYADIILGDYWGIEKEIPELNTNTGISCIVLNTKKGIELWEGIQEEVYYRESTYDAIIRQNGAVEASVSKNENRKRFFEELDIGGVVEEALRNNLQLTRVTDEDRFLYQYTTLYKYLKRQLSGDYLSRTLCRIGLEKVALYSITDLLDLIIIDISKMGNYSIYISDRNYERYGDEYKGFSVVAPYSLKEMLSKGELDGIIICNMLRENDIFEELIAQGFEQQALYSFTALLFD